MLSGGFHGVAYLETGCSCVLVPVREGRNFAMLAEFGVSQGCIARYIKQMLETNFHLHSERETSVIYKLTFSLGPHNTCLLKIICLSVHKVEGHARKVFISCVLNGSIVI